MYFNRQGIYSSIGPFRHILLQLNSEHFMFWIFGGFPCRRFHQKVTQIAYVSIYSTSWSVYRSFSDKKNCIWRNKRFRQLI